MPIVTTAARNQIRALHGEWLGDLAVSVAIRRGSTTLPAQDVRIVSRGSGQRTDAGAIEQAQSDVYVIGAPDLDIQKGDRLTHPEHGQVYEVRAVRPDRLIKTTADATLIQ